MVHGEETCVTMHKVAVFKEFVMSDTITYGAGKLNVCVIVYLSYTVYNHDLFVMCQAS